MKNTRTIRLLALLAGLASTGLGVDAGTASASPCPPSVVMAPGEPCESPTVVVIQTPGPASTPAQPPTATPTTPPPTATPVRTATPAPATPTPAPATPTPAPASPTPAPASPTARPTEQPGGGIANAPTAPRVGTGSTNEGGVSTVTWVAGGPALIAISGALWLASRRSRSPR